MEKIIGKGFVITKTDKSKKIAKYRNMTTYNAEKASAKEASDDGRCWWVYQFLMANTALPFHEKKEQYGKKIIKKDYCRET